METKNEQALGASARNCELVISRSSCKILPSFTELFGQSSDDGHIIYHGHGEYKITNNWSRNVLAYPLKLSKLTLGRYFYDAAAVDTPHFYVRQAREPSHLVGCLSPGLGEGPPASPGVLSLATGHRSPIWTSNFRCCMLIPCQAVFLLPPHAISRESTSSVIYTQGWRLHSGATHLEPVFLCPG